MVKLRINNRDIEAKKGMTVREAAAREGIKIPAICYNSDAGHFASCMVCVVKDKNSSSLIPSCSVLAAQGMEITTDDQEIQEARKTAIELLLSEHVGDCEAPCRIACPANMDIPLMNRFLAEGNANKALEVVMKDIAMPSVLGRICPAPCEGACHRKGIDDPVSICVLKRFAGDQGNIEVRQDPPREGKVAVIGAGIAGLSAVWFLQVKGFGCALFDDNPQPGGALRYEIDEKVLDREVLDRETGFILGSGVEYHPGTRVDKARFDKIVKEYDAVVVATGNFTQEIGLWGLANNGKQVGVDKNSYQTSIPNVFAVGNVNRSTRLAIRSAAQGKEVAFSIVQFLAGSEPSGEHKPFNSRIGRLREAEYPAYMNGISSAKRVEPAAADSGGFAAGEAVSEAGRCMHCECLKPAGCILRSMADRYGASQRRFSLEERKSVRKTTDHDIVVFEPGKCIRCGICVRLAAKYNERPGLTYIGRGYDVEIAVPFDENINKAVKKAGSILAEACPTGAIALRAGEPIKIDNNEAYQT
jgi:ferredoxin